MAINKLVLEDLVEDDFSLIAIHCSAEIYKIVFNLNKILDLSLERQEVDLDFSYPEGLAFYELYKYDNQHEGCNYYVVSNKCKTKSIHLQSNGFLFEEETKRTAHLLPEYKNVDCFLKIEMNSEYLNTKKLLFDINQINQIVTAYQVEVTELKSIENLIFS